MAVKRRNAAPELALQIRVAQYLTWCLPDNIIWTASLSGIPTTMNQAVKNKAAGVRRGWPDLSFLMPDGVARFIELKAKAGTLTPEQKLFQAMCAPYGNFVVCRSVEEVEMALRSWGVALKAHPFAEVEIER